MSVLATWATSGGAAMKTGKSWAAGDCSHAPRDPYPGARPTTAISFPRLLSPAGGEDELAPEAAKASPPGFRDAVPRHR
eukprot:10158665-Alexandrium_andersonii.AAC.1